MYYSKSFARRIALLAASALGVSTLVAAPAMGHSISVSTVASPKTSVAIMNIGTGTTGINDDRITHPKHFDLGAGSQAATNVVSVKDGAGLSTSLPVNKLLFPFTTVTFIRSKATTTLDLPIASGVFTLSGRLGIGGNLATSLHGPPLSASLTILTAQDVDSAPTRVLAAASERSATAALEAAIALTAIVKNLVAIILRIQKRLGIKWASSQVASGSSSLLLTLTQATPRLCTGC
jgi:hypothetical protein